MTTTKKRVRKITTDQLRRMIRTEARRMKLREELKGGDVEDAKAKETPWEEEEHENDVDWLKAQGVKSESALRRLKMRETRLARRLRETRRMIKLSEARARRSVRRRDA